MIAVPAICRYAHGRTTSRNTLVSPEGALVGGGDLWGDCLRTVRSDNANRDDDATVCVRGVPGEEG